MTETDAPGAQRIAPNLILAGFMGSGKSAVGRRVAAWTGMPFVDLDASIETQAGMPVAKIFERLGEAAFRRLEREILAAELAPGGRVIAVGGGAVVDAENRRRLLDGGMVVRLKVSVDTVLARLAGDRSRPLLNAPDRRARIEALLDARAEAYAAIPWTVETDGQNPDEVARDVLQGYEQRRRGASTERIKTDSPAMKGEKVPGTSVHESATTPLRLGAADLCAALERLRRPYQDRYLAMYLSDLDAIVTDPVLMRVPVDDHMVHRGDGVFEVCKFVQGALYNFEAHLDRLECSAAAVGLAWPGGRDRIRALSLAAMRAGGERDGLLRILFSRGPGGFSVDPYECPCAALYIIVTRAPVPFMTRHPEGARMRRSNIPAKPALFAGVKNCNYLPNVLMKKEATDWGVDFVVGIDHNGYLTEGATENVGIVTTSGELRFPRLEQVLRGTTMLRVADLARALLPEGLLSEVRFGDIPASLPAEASEMLVVGTTANVVAVCEFEGRPIGTGRPGPVWARLDALLREDLAHNEVLRTPIGFD